MKSRDHGRYRYSAIKTRPTYDWPGGKRLAVYLGLNLETFAFAEGFGAQLTPAPHQPDVLNYAWRDWGNRVGAWRLLDLFEAEGFPASVLLNTDLYDEAPELVAAFRARGDEIVGHGRTNSERQGTLAEPEERALIDEATARIRAYEGSAPQGWLGPWISESERTPDLLAEAGYHYVLDWPMDDQPVYLDTRSGKRLLAVPYPQELNDIPAIVARQASGAEFAQMIVDSFDEMLELSREAPLVMGIALHAYIVGHPHRLRPLRQALRHIAAARDDIWITTAGAIAEHCLALPPGVVPGGEGAE
ncbi:MAG TPA: polysaccharide deacetylase family protein [Roseiarcus sp.]